MTKKDFFDMFSRFIGLSPMDDADESNSSSNQNTQTEDNNESSPALAPLEALFAMPVMVAGDLALVKFANAAEDLFEESLPRWTVITHICPVIIDKRTSFDTWQKTQIAYTEEKENDIISKTNIRNKDAVLEFIGETIAKVNRDIKTHHTIHGIGAFSTERKTTIKLHRIPVFEVKYANKNFRCLIEPTQAKVDPITREAEIAYSIPKKFWKFRQPKRRN